MEVDTKTDRRVYMRSYYDENKSKMIRQIIKKQSFRRNSDNFIDKHRDKLIDDLNSGKRKFLQLTTSAKYNIKRDKKTLNYYHNIQELPTIDEKLDEPINFIADQTEAIVDDINLIDDKTEAIVDDINSNESLADGNQGMSIDMLKAMLKQEYLSDEDRTRILLYSQKKKNKKKRILIRCIFSRFHF